MEVALVPLRRGDRRAHRRAVVPLSRAGVPAIYVKDNHGHWRSNFRGLVAAAPSARDSRVRAQRDGASCGEGEE